MKKNTQNKGGKKYFILLSLFSVLISLLALSCVDKKGKAVANPPGYNINKPEKYSMPDVLQEISGIAFNKGDSRFVYAEQDEEGMVFKLPLGTKDETKTKFAGKGDYEDISIAKDKIIMLKSNGTLYTFGVGETAKEKANGVIVNNDLVPKGEYEGLYADENTNQVYVLCKNCKIDKGTQNTSGYILNMQANGTFKPSGKFTIDVSQVDKLTGKRKGSFHPSAFAIHPITKEWYIVSSVNKTLLVTDANWKIKGAYHLSSNIYNQPEGIAFDKAGNLYISNEGSETQVGNILKFDYKKP